MMAFVLGTGSLSGFTWSGRKDNGTEAKFCFKGSVLVSLIQSNQLFVIESICIGAVSSYDIFASSSSALDIQKEIIIKWIQGERDRSRLTVKRSRLDLTSSHVSC